MRTPYKTFYAFEEIPAFFKDEPGRHDTILASTERLSNWLTNGKVSVLRPVDEAQRQTVIASLWISNIWKFLNLSPCVMLLSSEPQT